jgi:hypothetical protein
MEIPADASNRSDLQEKIYKASQFWQLVPSLTALSCAVHPGHLVHETEPLIQLLYATTINVTQYNVYEDDSLQNSNYKMCLTEGIEKDKVSLDKKYSYIRHNLKRIILGTLDHTNSIEWLTSYISAIVSIYNDSQDNVSIIEKLPYLSVYLKSHLSNLNEEMKMRGVKSSDYNKSSEKEEKDNDGICFEQLLVLGRANSHVKYFGSEDIAMNFKKRIYEQVGELWSEGRSIEYVRPTDLRAQKMRVTLVLRGGPERTLTNAKEVFATLAHTPFVDTAWLTSHIMTFESLSFATQIHALARTDVLVTVHGAAVFNGIFMRHGSVVIDLLNGPFIEYVFAPALREAGVRLIHVPVVNASNQCTSCPWETLPDRCRDTDLVDGGDIHCVALRRCSVAVDINLFRAAIYEAYYHILSTKWS